MPITTQFIEEKVFAGLRRTMNCSCVMARFNGAGSAEVEGLLSGSASGTYVTEEGTAGVFIGTLYIRASQFPGMQKDKIVEVLKDDDNGWQERRIVSRGDKAGAIKSFDLMDKHGRRQA